LEPENHVNSCFIAAAALIVVIGLVHSVLGERLVFQRMRTHGIVPVNGGQILHESSVRILWASWHIVTILGWCIAGALWWLALPANAALAQSGLVKGISGALLGSSALVFFGTKSKHPGWAGLLTAAMLTFAGMYA
jgi:hypothetical protein